MKRIYCLILIIAAFNGADIFAAAAQKSAVAPAPQGALDSATLSRIAAAATPDASDRAISLAMSRTDLDRLALDPRANAGIDSHFSIRVPSRGITDQKQSGRCWLFTGLNVIRSQMMLRNDLPELHLSQAYNFFYDQLEKSNLFLQAIIQTADKPLSDRTVDFLLRNPLSDGGQYTGLSSNIMKYGVVPAEAMPETYTAEHTSKVSRLLSNKLREWALALRELSQRGAKPEDLRKKKEEMLAQVYRLLTRTIGTPPQSFTWTRRDTKGNVVDTRTYTPREFYAAYAGQNLADDYIMVMNDPSRPYWRLYEIDLDRHSFDSPNWTYINLPVEEIKQMAVASLRDSVMMYFSCDVGKFLDRDKGVLNPDAYDYSALLGLDFNMDKAQRIRTYASASSHAMTLCAVDLDTQGAPVKWLVENSWGAGANGGHLIITDPWFDEYMFRLVVNKRYAPEAVLKVLEQKPELLPAWDPMFADED